MALDPVVNFFRSTIATLPVASGGTSIVLQTGDGNKLPAPAVDGAFNLTIYNADDPFVAPEIVRVTARSGDTLTVTRAQEGTSATNKTAGSTWNVELTPTAKTIQDIDSKKLDIAGGTMTGDLTIPDKIIHSGDTNTAIRFPANDTVTVETAGVERMRVTSAGDVGIGTTSPEAPLHIKKTGGSTNSINIGLIVNFEATGAEQVGAGTAIVLRGKSSGGNIGNYSQAMIATNNPGTNNSHGLGFYVKPNALSELIERMRIESAGNVGIGTTSPATRLDVNGDVTITDKIIHSGDTNTAIRFPAADTVSVETNGSEALRVDSSQNVGINFTSPVYKIDSGLSSLTSSTTDARLISRFNNYVSAKRKVAIAATNLYEITKSGNGPAVYDITVLSTGNDVGVSSTRHGLQRFSVLISNTNVATINEYQTVGTASVDLTDSSGTITIAKDSGGTFDGGAIYIEVRALGVPNEGSAELTYTLTAL